MILLFLIVGEAIALALTNSMVALAVLVVAFGLGELRIHWLEYHVDQLERTLNGEKVDEF